jgi:hypothetical protein
MKSSKPLVLVVNRSGTVQRRARRGVGQRSHLRLVAAEGVALARVAGLEAGRVARAPSVAPVARAATRARAPLALVPAPRRQRPPCSLSRPLGQRIVQAANDVALLALALLSGLRPRA